MPAALKKSDPFTSDNARVDDALDPAARRRIEIEGQAVKPKAISIFGAHTFLDFKKFAGLPGEWRCGFRSWYGLHVRGKGDTALAAITVASRSRLPDDPTPSDPSWVPSTFRAPYTTFIRADRAQAVPPC